MREVWSAADYGLHRGLAMAQYYTYLKGVHNELAEKHIPEVLPRNDTIGGPYGRKADMVGGIQFMHIADLRKLSPLWLNITADVRFDPDVGMGGGGDDL